MLTLYYYQCYYNYWPIQLQYSTVVVVTVHIVGYCHSTGLGGLQLSGPSSEERNVLLKAPV